MGDVAKTIAGAALSAAFGPAGFTISGFLLSAVSSIALSAISRALAPKPKSAAAFNQERAKQSRTQNVRQPITSHSIVYGQQRVSGPILFVSSTNGNNYLHMVVALAPHEVEGIDEVWLNETPIPPDYIDESGNVIDGRFSGYVRIKKHLGDPTQGADTDLVAEVEEWTSNHYLKGIAYVYVRMQFNQDKFPSGIPNVSAIVRGKKIVDPRDTIAKFTTNHALFLYDYLTDQRYGVGTNDIDLPSIIAAANICDEFVSTSAVTTSVLSVSADDDTITLNADRLRYALGDRVTVTSDASLPAGITDAVEYYVIPYQFRDAPRIRLATSFENALHGIYIGISSAGSGSMNVIQTGEPRYHGSGTLDSSDELGNNIETLLSGMAGRAFNVGGLYNVLAGAYSSPSITLDENDFIEPFTVQTALERAERFNLVRGVFTSQINDWQPSDFPPIDDSASIGRLNETIPIDLDLPFTNRPFTAQRIAKIELKKGVQDIVVKAKCGISALRLQCGDTVSINNTRLGWSAKVFEVTSLGINFNDATQGISVDLELRETASDIYDWSTTEESDIDVAPGSNLPNAFDVPAVGGVAFSSRAVGTAQDDTVFMLVLEWEASSDTFVTSGGQYEIQFKLSSEETWRPSFFVEGGLTFSDVQTASVNTQYDLRIRAISNLGVRSSWTTIFGAVVGSSGGVGSTEDWGLFSESVTTSEDWQTFTDSVTSSEDWEFFT